MTKKDRRTRHKRIIAFSIVLCVLICGIIFLAVKIVRKNAWRITHYASVTGNQSMFYTIRDRDGNLAVIDGGWTEDEENFTNIIRENGNHISAWIITHPHPDHVGAFNAVYPKLDQYGITVDRIYATAVNHDRYLETAQSYDVPEAYTTFYELTKDADNLTCLKEDDELELLPGLHMKVLHGWDESVDATEANLCNNGSLMFKLYGNTESMLFCADTQKEMETYILDRHADELPSDYVQCGHHGNWGMTTDFYRKVNPKAAFMDGPAWLYESSDTYDGWELAEYFREEGVTMYTLSDAPNGIVLY